MEARGKGPWLTLTSGKVEQRLSKGTNTRIYLLHAVMIIFHRPVLKYVKLIRNADLKSCKN